MSTTHLVKKALSADEARGNAEAGGIICRGRYMTYYDTIVRVAILLSFGWSVEASLAQQYLVENTALVSTVLS